ncbi:unnamed protein product [Urochloa humidicola]
MWKRHVLTATSQITVAIYVFCKTWSGGEEAVSGNNLDLHSRYKCLEKPWALKKASINSMAEAFGARIHEATGVKSLDEYVQAAAGCVRRGGGDEKPSPDDVNEKPYKLFVDLPYSYSVRLQNLKYMVQIRKDDDVQVHLRLCPGMSNTFRRLYTKSEVYNGRRGTLLRGVAVILTFAAIGLFHWSHREAYNNVDVKVTYIDPAVLHCCPRVDLGLPEIVFQLFLREAGWATTVRPSCPVQPPWAPGLQ